MRITITDLSIQLRLPYGVTYARALRGDYGVVVREGARLIVVQDEKSGIEQRPSELASTK